MKKLILILFALGMSISLLEAQDQASADSNVINNQKERKEVRKQLNKLKAEANLKRLDTLVNNMNWVIEANTIFNRDNMAFVVNPTLNFVSLRDSTMVIQFGSNSRVGNNGVGGLTLQGRVTQYKVNKSKNIFIKCDMLSSLTGNSDVFINVYPDGRATAKFQDNWGNRYTFDGYLVPAEESRVYQGMTTY